MEVVGDSYDSFAISHNPVEDETSVLAFTGTVSVTLAGSNQPAFALGPAQSVIVAGDGAGPIRALPQLFLPTVRR
ncbi:MAG: hypothetical protein KJZ86_08920 [Caldilineaceae bacterium]|nr:hypothetical protein [Caldilineaceae bacterium]